MASKTVEIIVKDVFESAGGFAGMVAGFKNVQAASAETTKSVANLEPTLSEQGSKASETGKKVGAAVGVAVGGAIVSGFASSVSFDASKQKLEASFAEGSAAAKVAGEATGKLYADGYTESFDEIGQATKKVMQSTEEMKNATTEQVTEITGQFLSLSKVMNIDVGSAIESVATLVKTKMVPDMQSGIDLVVATYQKLGPAADGVISAVQKNAEEFQRLGIDGKEAMGLIVQGMDAGAGSAEAVTNSFKLFTNTVLSGTKASEEGLKALGLATDEYGPKSKAAGATASASFTVSAADADHARQIIENMGLSIDTIKDKADKSGKTTSESFKVGGAAVAELQTKLDEAGITMTSFSDTVAKGSKAGADNLKVIGINSDEIRGKLAAGGATANAAFADIITRLKEIKDPLVQNTIGTELFGKSWKTVSESILAFDPSSAAAGLGKVDGAAKAMNATVEDTAQNKLTAMKNRFQELTANFVNAPGILGTATTAIAAFGVSGIGALSGIAQISQALPGGFTGAIKGMISALGEFVSAMIGTQAVGEASAAATAGAWIAANLTVIATGGLIALAIGAIILVVVELVKHWQLVKEVAGIVWDFMKKVVKDFVDFVVDLFLNFTLPGIIIKHWNTIWDFTKKAWDFMMGILKGFVDFVVMLFMNFTLPGIILNHWNQITSFITRAIDVIRNAIGSFASWLGSIGSSMWDGIKNGAREMVNGVIDVLNGLIESVNAVISAINLIPGVTLNPITHIPHASFATGGISSGGLALVGERGPELVNLPTGSYVRSAPDSQALGGTGVIQVNVTVDSGGSMLDDLLVQILRKSIRVNGGNVQTFLGTS